MANEASSRKARPLVLIVDDNDTNLIILKTFMSFYDCDVLLAKDGRKALQHFTNHQVDLVLMDVMMPGMDGFEAAREMRRIEHARGDGETPIIAVTAHVQPSDQHQCVSAGMNDYVAKPLKSRKLIDALKLWRPEMDFNPHARRPAGAAARPAA